MKSDLFAAAGGIRPFVNTAEAAKEKPQPESAKPESQRRPIRTFSQLESRFNERPNELSFLEWKEMFGHLSRLASPDAPEAHRLLYRFTASLLRDRSRKRDLKSLNKALLLMHDKNWTNVTIMEQMCDLFLSLVDFGSIVTPSLVYHVDVLGKIYEGRGIPLHSPIVSPESPIPGHIHLPSTIHWTVFRICYR